MHQHGCRCSVKISGLSVTRGKEKIISNINLYIRHGEIVALVGKNGAGKTTILKSIINSVKHLGDIEFFNSSGFRIKSPKIGYVPQRLSFDRNTPMTVLDLFCTNSTRLPIWLGHSRKRVAMAYELLEKVGAHGYANKTIGRLSGGELQRVLLAFAIDPMPDILLLDEPVSAVDRSGIDVFYRLIKSMREEYHMPVFMVSHDLLQISQYATSYALIENGVVEIGKACDLMNSKKVQESMGFKLGEDN